MIARLVAYTTTVGLATLLLLSYFDWSSLQELTRHDVAGITVFVLLGIAADLLGVSLPVAAKREARSSIAFIPLFACALHYPAAVAVLVAGTVNALSSVIRGRAPVKIILNAAVGMLAIGSAASILDTLGGVYAPGTPGMNFLAFAVFVLVAFFVNIVLVSGGLAWLHRRRLAETVRHSIGGGGANVLFDLLASPFAFITALLYRDNGIAGLLMIVLPLIVIRSSYMAKVQLQQANQDLLRVLIKAIETRDPYTSGHSVRVSIIARFIAEDLGLSRHKCDRVEQAALLHDIGKIDAAYSAMIRKPSPLTDSERKVIQTHATNGAALLDTLSSVDREIIRAVRHHHEHYDGSGYPDGLSGSDIPLAARIIMLADSIDAMLSDRPYRSALTMEQAYAELDRCGGTQFDPFIVDVIKRRDTLRRAAAIVRMRRSEPHSAIAAVGG